MQALCTNNFHELTLTHVNVRPFAFIQHFNHFGFEFIVAWNSEYNVFELEFKSKISNKINSLNHQFPTDEMQIE